MENLQYIILAIILINILIQFGIIIKYLTPFCEDLLLNKRKRWNPNHDLLFTAGFIVLFITTIFFSKFLLGTPQNIYIIFFIILIQILITGMMFLFYKKMDVIKKSAENKIISSEKSDTNYDFKIAQSKIELEKIFDKLSDNNFIEMLNSSNELLDKDLFVQTLNNGIVPDKILFKLNMDNIQTKYFYDQLTGNSHKLTRVKFMKIFKNNNPKATPSSLSSSKSKSKNTPKQIELLETIFKG